MFDFEAIVCQESRRNRLILRHLSNCATQFIFVPLVLKFGNRNWSAENILGGAYLPASWEAGGYVQETVFIVWSPFGFSSYIPVTADTSVPYSDVLAKYAAAFFRMSRSSSSRFSSALRRAFSCSRAANSPVRHLLCDHP